MRLSISNRICVFSWNLDIFFSSFNDFMQGQVTLRKRGLTMPKGNLVAQIQNHKNPQLKCLQCVCTWKRQEYVLHCLGNFFSWFQGFRVDGNFQGPKTPGLYMQKTRYWQFLTNSDFPGIFPIFSHRSYIYIDSTQSGSSHFPVSYISIPRRSLVPKLHPPFSQDRWNHPRHCKNGRASAAVTMTFFLDPRFEGNPRFPEKSAEKSSIGGHLDPNKPLEKMKVLLQTPNMWVK